mgnify:CR=1 FL=1
MPLVAAPGCCCSVQHDPRQGNIWSQDTMICYKHKILLISRLPAAPETPFARKLCAHHASTVTVLSISACALISCSCPGLASWPSRIPASPTSCQPELLITPCRHLVSQSCNSRPLHRTTQNAMRRGNAATQQAWSLTVLITKECCHLQEAQHTAHPHSGPGSDGMHHLCCCSWHACMQ